MKNLLKIVNILSDEARRKIKTACEVIGRHDYNSMNEKEANVILAKNGMDPSDIEKNYYHYYVNFYFKELIYDDNMIVGHFEADDISCDFSYDRNIGKCEIWNNNKNEIEIRPLPIYYLLKEINESNKVLDKVCKISI